MPMISPLRGTVVYLYSEASTIHTLSVVASASMDLLLCILILRDVEIAGCFIRCLADCMVALLMAYSQVGPISHYAV